MKRKSLYSLGISLILVLAQITSTQAQIFKKILNEVKQNQQNPIKSNSSNQSENIDTTGLNNDLTKVLGAFGKAASDNPNDTSAADLTMRALGNLTGGGGVSAADSASAIKTFKTATAGSGVYYESTSTTTTKNGTNKAVSKTYFTASGEARKEMNLGAMMGAKNSEALIVLSRAGNPRYSIILDDKQKEYSLDIIDTSFVNNNQSNYKVTKMGNETILGYNCAHAKVVVTSGKGMFASSSTMEVWTSPAVPGYSELARMMTSQNITNKMLQALDQAGCSGYFVKITSQDKDYSMNMELTKVEKRTFPASLFVIPAGYARSEGNLMFSNLVQASQNK